MYVYIYIYLMEASEKHVLSAEGSIDGITCRAVVDPSDMCSGSEEGSYVRPIYLLYHSTLGLRVIKKKRRGEAGALCRGVHRRHHLQGYLAHKKLPLPHRTTVGP